MAVRPARSARIARAVVVAAVAVATGSAAYAAHGSVFGQHNTAGPPAGSLSPPIGVAPTGVASTRHLQPALRHAFAAAQRAAAAQGVALHITSGWRSHDEQARLFAAAVQKYGSREAAGHWVLPPGESAHERGAAIDVGPPSGAAWLDVHGVHYGLCRRYANESWHFELLAPALGQPCPALEPYAHAT
jgi:hypothetical protein